MRPITYSSQEAAEIAGCSITTIEEYARKGLIHGVRIGHWRFPSNTLESDLNRLARETAAERKSAQHKVDKSKYVLHPPDKHKIKKTLPDLSAA